MARSRNIKPGFFVNEDLVELPFATRLLFAGLWTLADREGRLDDRPKRIKMAIFPADDVNVDAALDELAAAGLIIRYTVDVCRYIQIVNFTKHQNPHHQEKPSVIPPPPNKDGHFEPIPDKPEISSEPIVLIPSSLIPDSLQPSTPAVAGGDGLAEAEHQSLVVTGVKREFGLKKLSAADQRAWQQASVLAFENDFTPDEFLECLALLRKQHWRTSAVKPQHVVDNLTILPRLRAEAAEQAKANGPPERLPTLEDKQAELAASRKTLIPPPSAPKELRT